MIDQQLLPLQMECTFFFEQNTYAMETAAGVALRLGRNLEDITPVLTKLELLSILERIGEGEKAIYRYNTPKIQSEVMLE
jgi:hypothetical protein